MNAPEQGVDAAEGIQRPGYSFCKRNGVLLTQDGDGRPVIWVRQGASMDALMEVQRLNAQMFPVQRADPNQFDLELQRAYEQGEGAAASLVEGLGGGDEAPDDLDALAHALAENQDLLESEDDAPVIRFINGLLVEAIKENASDIHVETFETRCSVRFRVDGVMREIMSPPRQLAPRLVSRIKIMAKLDIAEKRLPQDGRITRSIGGRKVDVRVSTLPTGASYERVVMRVLDKQNEKIDLEHLGLNANDTKVLKRIINKPYGIMLVTGPTGSGKSTTLYAALSVLNDKSRNIMTVEDPIEYNIEGIGQTQVNPKVNMTFARGLRAILRQDPDVVMIGEIRDLETAEIAVQASLTGHLVLSTLHTNTAVGAITRLRDMGVEPYLLSTSIIGLMAQRLVRVLCPHCKEAHEAEPVEREALGIKHSEPVTLYREKGCSKCRGTGFLGRTGIHELVEVDQEMEVLIHDNAGEQALESHARKSTPGIMASGRQKVLDGVTTVREILRVTTED
ncbi:type II secretion system ATPase GspE [Algiphilus sp.]|uniref:type II secretion system ATPase GspE n=1 Tax=Algiphilus sp. TaxID=1872431 RepID=UPI0025BEFF26|nr:type II secretion system ATPase GspE [Algiphilus sp.]MCI5103248.1 type II secretion system ATPase GspE [Algiphilus sp.]